MNRTLARIALGEVKRLRVVQTNYDAECASYAAEGYRPRVRVTAPVVALTLFKRRKEWITALAKGPRLHPR